MTRAELETLVTYFVADVSDLKQKLKDVEGDLQQAARTAEQSSNKIESSISGIAKSAITTAAVIFGLGGAIHTLFDSVKLAAQGERTEASFNALIGNAEEAKKALADVRKFALETPFQAPELIEAARMMVAFGTQAKNLVPTMQLLGEVSAGLDVPLKDLAYVYGTLQQQGRAYSRDILQFATRGIPIYLELAKVLGMVGKQAKEASPEVMQQLHDMIEKGQINFKQVEAAFKNMTGPGGQFFGQLETQSKTLIGLFNNMKEQLETTLRSIGNTLISGLSLKDVVAQIAEASTRFNDWLASVDVGTKRMVLNTLALSAAFIGLIGVLVGVKVALTAAFGPVGLIVGVLVSVAGMIALYAEKVGGLGKVWKEVKQGVSDFYDFARPIFPAIAAAMILLLGPVGPIIAAVNYLAVHWRDVKKAVADFYAFSAPILRAAWSLIKEIAFTLRDDLAGVIAYVAKKFELLAFVAGDIWRELTGGTQVTWKSIQTFLRDMMILGEFAWRNFGRYAELGVVKAMEFFTWMEKSITFFFQSTVPELLVYFLQNWKAIFTAAFTIAKYMIDGVMSMLVEGIVNLEDIISGKVDFAKIAAKHMKLFNMQVANEIKKLPDITITPRIVSPEEKNLSKWAQELEKDIGVSGFFKFRDNKLLQFQFEDAAQKVMAVWEDIVFPMFFDVTQKAGVAGTDAGAAFAQNFGKKFEKVDATLFDSAEAISRAAEYRMGLPDSEFINQIRQQVVVQTTPPPPNAAELESVGWLKRIHEVLDKKNVVNPFTAANI